MAVCVTFALTGCDKDLLNTIPNDRISTELFWKTEKDAQLAANAIYLYLDNTRTYVAWDAMSDIGHVTLQWWDESFIEKGSHLSNNGRINNEWKNNFKGIQAANIFLDNVNKIETLNPGLINSLVGEVKFLRAFYYLRLVSLFGDVPLLTKTITLEESKTVSRTPIAQVYDFISAELTEAAQKLPVKQTQTGRVTKGAALSLKARAMLFAGRFTEAATAAKEVIDLKEYDLYASYKNLFSYQAENSKEVIFDRQFIKSLDPNDIYNYITPNSIWAQRNALVPTKQIVDAYQMKNGKLISDPTSGFDPYNPYKDRDPRLKYTIFTIGDTLPNGKIYDSRPNSGTADAIGYSENTTPTGFNAKKYLNKEDMAEPSNCGINFIFIRYAEVLLTYAEAKIEANQIDNNVLDAINQVRQRTDVNMPKITGISSQTELRIIVRRERMVELAFEGLRYFDIRRWKIAENVVPGILMGMTYADAAGNLKTVTLPGYVKTFDKNRDYLWPIPNREIELNSNLKQNPNW